MKSANTVTTALIEQCAMVSRTIFE